MKRHLYTILLPVAAALALSGCTTGSEEADEHYIKLSDAVCTFTEDGGEAQIIEVRANPEWSFESGASWLKVSAGEGSTLEVSVDPNADGERNAEITLQAGEATASIRVYQLGARGLSARYRLLEQLNSAVMSPSGRYAGGFVISIAPDGKIALSIKQTQPAPERAPRAPRSPRPQGQQGSNGGARPAGGRPPRREAAPRVWQPKPSQPQGDLSFEDMMARYKTQSEEKIADLKRVTENHRGGYSRRRG